MVGYDGSKICSLWNGLRVIYSKNIIFDEKLVNLMKIGLLILLRVISTSLIIPTDSQVFKPKSELKISQNSSDII